MVSISTTMANSAIKSMAALSVRKILLEVQISGGEKDMNTSRFVARFLCGCCMHVCVNEHLNE